MPQESTTHSFSAFPKDDKPWEVIMYGDLQDANNGSGVNLLLAEAEWRYGSTRPQTRQVFRPIGDVAGLPIGSRWVNGATAARDVQAETSIIDVPALEGWPTNKLGETVWDAGDRGLYPIIGSQAAPTWRIRTGDQTYFVPAVELIRAVFGPTTEFLRLAIEGGLTLWPNEKRSVFDLAASGRDPSDPGVIRIKAHRSLHRREAETVARILTNDRMRRAFMQIFASKQRAVRDGRILYPTTIFPFDEPTRWKVDTAWTKVTSENPSLKASRRRLITRIRSIKTSPLSFRKIVVELQGNAGDLMPGEKRRTVPMKSSDRAQGKIRVDPYKQPSTNLATMALDGGHTAYESGFELEHIVTDASGRQSAVVIEDTEDQDVDMGSTAWAAGDRGVVGIAFQSTSVDFPDEPRRANALLMATRNALERIASKRNWPCELISPPSGCGADLIDGLFRYPPVAGNRTLRWSTVQRDGRLRRALVMRITTDRGDIYVVDAERHGKEAQALGLIFTPLATTLTDDDIETILAVNSGERGVWRGMTNQYPTAKLARKAIWYEDLSAYGVHILGVIAALNEGRQPPP
jgi:hypothetical protein